MANESSDRLWKVSSEDLNSPHPLGWESFKMYDEMQANNRQVEDEVEQAIWQERERLARELHDTIVPEVYTIGLFLEALELALKAGKSETVEKGLLDLLATARESLAGLRLVLLGLSPPVLEDVGLVEALRIWLALVQARNGIKIDLNVIGRGLPPTRIAEALYRIAQEAVNNVIKHARADMVSVEILLSENLIRLQVQDNGRGFDPESVRADRMGLRNIERRAAEVQALCTIDTLPGNGTLISVEYRP